MELAKIENLLEAYFEGNTTLDEEHVLQQYFAQSYVPAHLQEYKVMFDYFSESKAEVSSQQIQVTPKKKTWKMNWLSIAASLILLFAIYKIVPGTDSFTDIERAEAERAYVESQKAFELISKSINRGNGTIAYLDSYEVTKNKIFKTKK
ncbi:MAG TPA: hypothetical protein EYP87_00690 [Flavobacteriaceae bacterium]|nr:hypothetical protein [Flavobacteriaceae bacterium]